MPDPITAEVLPRLRSAIRTLDNANLHFADVNFTEAGELAQLLTAAEAWLLDPEGMASTARVR